MQSQRGFTLLEILVAVAILGVALVSLLGLHARNLRLFSESQDVTIAGLLASRLAAETQAGAFPPIGTESPTACKRRKVMPYLCISMTLSNVARRSMGCRSSGS